MTMLRARKSTAKKRPAKATKKAAAKAPVKKHVKPQLKTSPARISKIIAGLQKAYPGATCALVHSNPWELLVATILSAQCNDKQVNIVTEQLFKKYRAAADYANTDPAELEREIKRIGLYRNKAKNIQAACRKLVERHGGKVPDNMEALINLAGVGRKTANVVLGNAFNINCGVVVDTHVVRLSARLGLTREKTPEKIEQALMQLVPQPEWTLFSHLLIWHGRRRCYARNPDCLNCEIKNLCPRIGLPKLAT
jgi:endonuclease-3